MGIDNTTRRMQDPVYRALMFDGTANPGGRPGMIEQQEADGQRQLVNSDRLPVKFNSGQQEDLEALGFTFGDPDPADPLFRPATLPPGWTRQGSDHAMWSYLLDHHGRRRVAIFYKAAWYDRDAFMSAETLWSYATAHAEEGVPLVLDKWATRPLRAHAGRRGPWLRMIPCPLPWRRPARRSPPCPPSSARSLLTRHGRPLPQECCGAPRGSSWPQ